MAKPKQPHFIWHVPAEHVQQTERFTALLQILVPGFELGPASFTFNSGGTACCTPKFLLDVSSLIKLEALV